MKITNEFTNCKICNGIIDLINLKFNLVKCQSCEFVFSKTIYSEEEFIATYDRLYNTKEDLKYSKHTIEEFNKLKNSIITIGYNRKRIISKVLSNKPQNILEIGSGIGLIGMYLKQFSTVSYVGLELDKKTHERALSLGVNSVNGDFSMMETLDKEFDVIMMWEVLEHLQDLDLFFQLAKERLKPQGVFIFSVPNFDKIGNYANPKDAIFQSGPPIHLNFFRKKSVKNVLGKYEFEVLDVSVKKFPYFNFKTFGFYKMLFKSFIGKYNGPTLYVTAKLKK
jgi:2-polyprenyl-3-methyl-5-hydroxy-6-metoxy-1,4-benzoquinol methylase